MYSPSFLRPPQTKITQSYAVPPPLVADPWSHSNLVPGFLRPLVPLPKIGDPGLGTPGDASGHLVGSGLNPGLVGA